MVDVRFAVPLVVATAFLLGGCSKSNASPSEAGPTSASSQPAQVPSSSVASPAPAESSAKSALPVKLLPSLEQLATSLPAGFDAIPEDRKAELNKLALFVRTRLDSGEAAKVVFICTHNSRRSHMGQIFATLASAHYKLDRVQAFSGGTEATAFNPRAVAALERLGFQFEKPAGDNPHYKVTFAEGATPIEAFSKKYDDPFNPKDGFAAVMTCDHADKTCPMVAGAALRIPLHFVDPKVSDDTPQEAATYDERAKQIATEVFYAFSRVRA